jgi:uncharacterized protein (TIGR01777 family)
MKQHPAPSSVVIAGGTGFIGSRLANILVCSGSAVKVLTRSKSHAAAGGVEYIHWDGKTDGDWVGELEGMAALVNLTGRTVDCVKTPENCDEILRSRVESTRALGRALGSLSDPPKVWVQMSTSHYYGDPASAVCTEESCPGYGLAPFVAKSWERAHSELCPSATRSVVLRTSFVLGKNGGALGRLALLSKIGLGGKVGSGKQGISWIHEDDLTSLICQAISSAKMSGAYIATAPNPVSNSEFMSTLRATLGIPLGLPAAAWMVRIGAPLFMSTDPELALCGRYCIPARLLREGFDFRFPELKGALSDILARR